MVIRSRIGNLFLILLGLFLTTIGVDLFYENIKQQGLVFFRHDLYSLILGLIFNALGVWCVIGGWRNLKIIKSDISLSQHQPDFSYRFAKWHLSLILVTGLLSLVTNLAGFSFGIILHYVFVAVFLSIPITLLGHLIAKILARRRA